MLKLVFLRLFCLGAGGIEIQSLTPSDSVMVLGTIKAHVAELENKPILVFPKKLQDEPKFDYELNLLVYPQIIKVPLILRSSHLPPSFNLRELAQKKWKNLPTFSDIVTANEKFFGKEKQTLFGKEIDIDTLKENQYLYPNIISMIHGNANHYFSKMIVEGDALNGSGGVLMALRDSFCNLTERTTIKIFYFDSLEGPNDISLILKSSRAVESDPNQKPIEKELPDDDERIILRNVIIRTQDEIEMTILIRFQLNNTAWEFKYDAYHWDRPEIFNPRWWAFNRIANAEAYEKEFKKEVRAIIRSSKSLKIKKKQKPLRSIFKKGHRRKYMQSIIE